MVRKLYKHEFLAWLRVMPVIYGIVLSVAGMHRVIQIFENDSVYYALISGSATFAYAVAVIGCLAAATVFGVVRFYKHLFTGEGYLTFTLPVTPANHLWVKMITALVFELVSLVVLVLSAMLVTAGDVFGELCKAAVYLAQRIPESLKGHLMGYLAEFAVLLLIAMLFSYLYYYTCICVGQRFRKNRVLAAVGVYFGIYMASQVLGTVASVVFVILGEAGVLDGVLETIGRNPEVSIHVFLGIFIVFELLLSVVCFLICHGTMRKRLNLE